MRQTANSSKMISSVILYCDLERQKINHSAIIQYQYFFYLIISIYPKNITNKFFLQVKPLQTIQSKRAFIFPITKMHLSFNIFYVAPILTLSLLIYYSKAHKQVKLYIYHLNLFFVLTITIFIIYINYIYNVNN